MVEQHNPVTVTAAAEQHLKKMCEINQCNAVRLGLTAGGCAGFKPEWSIADVVSDSDITIMMDGFRLIIDSQHGSALMGCTVDYVEDFINHNLVVLPPSGGTACGCGESISTSEDKSS